MTKMKKLMSVMLTFVMSFSLMAPAMAEDFNVMNIDESEIPESAVILDMSMYPDENVVRIPVGEAQYIRTLDGNVISILDLPKFDTREEADAFVASIKASLSDQSAVPEAEKQLSINTNQYDTVVASKAAGPGKVNLRIFYTTTGENHTGTVSHYDAYTELTGFTLGFSWDEDYCYANLTSTGLDIQAYSAGQLSFNLLVEGVIELYRQRVELSGTAYAIH